MTRHGESVNNILNIIGGDCNITKKGEEYSKILGSYFNNKKILGVHFRGSDQKISTGHPFPPTLKQIISYSKNFILPKVVN